MDKRIAGIKNNIKNTEYFFVGIFSFVVIAILILMMIYIPSVTTLIKTQAESEVRDAAASNTAAADVWFSSKITFLEAAASEFRNIDTSDAELIHSVCASICDNSKFRHVGFTTPDGVTVNSDGNTANTSNRTFIQAGLEGRTNIAARMQCDFDDELADMYTVPVYRNDGTLVGALTGDSEQFMFSDISLLDIAGRTDCFFIFDSEGDTVFFSGQNEVGIGAADNLLSLIDSDAESKDIGYLFSSVSREAFKYITIGGTEYMAAFAGINGTEWTFAAITSTTGIYNSFSGMIAFTAGLIAAMSLLLLVSMIVVIVMINRVRSDVYEVIDVSLENIYVDNITGHDTLAKFRENYAAAMKNSAAGHALVSLDVDHFKAVNDMFGFDGGNEIIKKISGVIKRDIGKNDFFARGGGDLFYIFTDFSDRQEIVELVNRIMSDVEYQITEVKLDLAIGIYILDDPHISSRVAADRADMARDSVKNSKQSRFSFFDNSMLDRIRREKKIEDIMEDALELGEFLVYLQPKFGLGEKNEVVGAEALVRWRHEGKLMPPGEFIPLFEKNGFVNKLDYYMFEEVCKLQKKYVSLGYKPKTISVNMSRLHIHKPGFVADLAAMCEKYEVDTKYIEIEITESAAYEDVEVLSDIFREIKGYGFHVSIDDFGTGYSSLNMLKDLPVDVLKIDRSFLTENADEHENASLIIGCVVSLAASLHIYTICEGIETKVQADLLTKLGCNMAQGFYFARPMPVADYEKLAYGIERK